MTLDGVPQRLALAPGEVQTFALPGAAGGGYAWQAHCGSGADVAEVSVQVAAPTPSAGPSSTPEPPALSLAAESVRVRALRPGTALWRLVLVRPFGPPQPWAEHTLQVDVLSGAVPPPP